MSQARIIIHIEGGLIQEIMSCDQTLKIFVHDSDETVDSSDKKMTQIDGKPVYLTKWQVKPEPAALPLFEKLNAAWEESKENSDGQDSVEQEDALTCEICGKESEYLCGCCGVCSECCTCTVALIASGYEWTCPICQTENNVMEVVQEVTCQGCGKTFQVDECNHAF